MSDVRKIQYKGWGLPHTVFARDLTSSAVFFHTSRVNGALTNLLFCVGRISGSSSDGFRQMCISDSLLPQEYEMKYVK